MIKVGRRGSQNGTLVVTGKQGHVAYPERADNPVRGLVALMGALMYEPLDQGTANFGPSNLEFTSIDIGNPTVNLIPGDARARFNVRFNDTYTQDSLRALIERRAQTAPQPHPLAHRWEPSNADAFLAPPGPFIDLVAGAIARSHRTHAGASTSGGTSDARFIKDYCPVIEFGLVGQTMHQVDERTPVADLVQLTAVYRRSWNGISATPTRSWQGRRITRPHVRRRRRPSQRRGNRCARRRRRHGRAAARRSRPARRAPRSS